MPGAIHCEGSLMEGQCTESQVSAGVSDRGSSPFGFWESSRFFFVCDVSLRRLATAVAALDSTRVFLRGGPLREGESVDA